MALVVLTAGEFAARGPQRGLVGSGDFEMIYVASRTWMLGRNPYDLNALAETRTESGSREKRPINSVYPPPTFVVMTPLAMVPYPAAKIAWLLVNVGLFVGLFLGLVSLARFRFTEKRTAVLAICLFALAPIHTGFKVGQVALATTTLIVLGLAATLNRRSESPTANERDRGSQVLGGVLLGVATALKPQMGGVFIAYLLYRRRWKAVTAACATTAVMATLAVTQMQVRGFDWLADFHRNVHDFTVGGAGDPTAANPYHWQLINLHHPLHTMIDDPTTVRLIVWAVGIVAAGVALGSTVRKQPHQRELALLSTLAVLTLVVIFHRVYDAVLLVLPLAWCIGRLSERRDCFGWVVALLLLPFAISGPAALNALVNKYEVIPPQIAEAWWWHTLVMPHHAWVLGALAAVLAYALWSTRSTPMR
ncbi:MAG: glycosyltransferase family 87 protein [Phycisphaeraceae bacterium]